MDGLLQPKPLMDCGADAHVCRLDNLVETSWGLHTRLSGPIARVAIMLVMAAVAACAQNRAEFPWWNSPVVADIGLSPEQTAKIRQVVRGYRNRLLDARNNVQKAEGDLEDLMNDEKVNSEAAKPAIEKLAMARAASTRVVLEMDIELRSQLTFDQWRLLVRRWDEVKDKKTNSLALPPE